MCAGGVNQPISQASKQAPHPSHSLLWDVDFIVKPFGAVKSQVRQQTSEKHNFRPEVATQSCSSLFCKMQTNPVLPMTILSSGHPMLPAVRSSLPLLLEFAVNEAPTGWTQKYNGKQLWKEGQPKIAAFKNLSWTNLSAGQCLSLYYGWNVHLRGWPALLFLGYYSFWVPSFWTQSISTWEQKERLCIIYNVFHLFLQPSSLHWEISEVWHIWGRTNSLMIPSNNYLMAINKSPIVAQREVRENGGQGQRTLI